MQAGRLEELANFALQRHGLELGEGNREVAILS